MLVSSQVGCQRQASDEVSAISEAAAVGRLPLRGHRAGLFDADVLAVHLLGVLARALAQGADHILLDEPTNHLDIRYQHEVLDLVAKLPGSATVVLHDLNLAARYCDHIIVLDNGRIAAYGTPDEVMVPEVLEPVYQVEVRRIDLDDAVHLLFRKATDKDTA